ncbi:MAG: CBS domain-containing protein [Chloroflexota bacterium]
MRTVRGRFNGSAVELLEDAPIKGDAYVLITFLEGSMETAAARAERRQSVSVSMHSLDRYSEPLRRRMGAQATEDVPPTPFTVGEVMTRKLISVSSTETVANAIHHMHQQGITSIIVEPDDSGEWGIMTMRDVLKDIVSADRSPEEVPVSEVVTRPLIYVSQDMSLRDCSKLMIDSNIRRAAVRHEGRPVGIISDTDIFQVVEERGWGPIPE